MRKQHVRWLIVSALAACLASCNQRPPPRSWFLENFHAHRSEYSKLAAAGLQTGPTTSEYRRYVRSIGAKSVSIGPNGSLLVTLWGHGCTFCDDHFMGLLFEKNIAIGAASGIQEVRSLDDAELPHENGRIASGFYVVLIEPHWYIYREDYSE